MLSVVYKHFLIMSVSLLYHNSVNNVVTKFVHTVHVDTPNYEHAV